jgi:hypothetical protein
MSGTSPVGHDDSPQNITPQLGVPGTPDFFASVLRFIRTTAPGIPLDPVIFQSIMLSVMAGNKHVLLRAKDEDITIVQNLAALVSNPSLVFSLVGDCSLLLLSPLPPFLCGMSLSRQPDIHRHTWLYDSQAQDCAAIGHVTLILHLIPLFFFISRSADWEIGLFQEARKTVTLPPDCARSQKAGQRTKRFVI